MNNFKYLIPLFTSVILVGCGGSTAEATPETPKTKADAMTPVVKETPAATEAPVAPTLSLTFTATKAFSFSWVEVPGATSYKLTEAVTSGSGYELIEETTATTTSFDHVVPLYARLNAKYILQSCNAIGCTASAPVLIDTSTRVADMVNSIGYLKASNAGAFDYFGNAVSLSADGNTLAVSALYEASNSMVINADPEDDSATGAGAVYVFTRSGAVWSEQAYLKANNATGYDNFGNSVSMSNDGNTLVVGAPNEDGDGSGPAVDAGAAYVFTRTGKIWTQQAYLKASNAFNDDTFGYRVSLSGDGDTLAVGATKEDSDETGVSGSGSNDDASNSGAVYVFTRNGIAWSHQAYLKASNTDVDDAFGASVSLSDDGNTLAVGARGEDSNSKVINRGQDNESAKLAGAVYVFTRSGTAWSHQAYLKARNTGPGDLFGHSVSLSANGNTLAVGAYNESSNTTGIDGDEEDNSAENAGAAYVFIRNTSANDPAWSQQAYLKASNTVANNHFGYSVSLSGNGNTLAVGSNIESRPATGINGDQISGIASSAGAVYTFTRSSTTWSDQAYLKATNTGMSDQFGYSVALSTDGGALAVGAIGEKSNATGINADQEDDSSENAGAVYVY